MKAELQYRTFEEVLAAASTDIPHVQLEGGIEPQQLIKVVTKINYELGLRINPARLKLLEIRDGKTRLPADFAVANYALYCGTDSGIQGLDCQDDPGYEKGLHAGLLLAQAAVEDCEGSRGGGGSMFTRVLTIVNGRNVVTHNLHDRDLIVQVLDPVGSEVLVRVEFDSDDSLSLYSDALVAQLDCTVRLYAASSVNQGECKECCQVLTTEQKVLIRYRSQSGRRTFYPAPLPLQFVRSKGVDSDYKHLFHWEAKATNEISIQQGFLLTTQRHGSIVLSYQSVLEDDEGSLLTLDHPKVNDYYEYALKEKIYENLWLSGEDVFQKLDYIQQRKLRPAKFDATSFVNTPSYAEFRKVWELNRKAQFHKYYQMFQ